GWYDLDHPQTLHVLFDGFSKGAFITFTPSAHFAFYFVNASGQLFSSHAADNTGDSSGVQHFAFFQTAPDTPTVPEPGTVPLSAIGMAALVIGRIRDRGRTI